MTTRSQISGQFVRGIVGATLGIWLSAAGCGSSDEKGSDGGTGGSLGTSTVVGGAGVTTGVGGTTAFTTAVDCKPESLGTVTHPGNYDNMSCNKANCHVGKVGGWLYASAKGYPWVSGATVTIKNTDGSVLTTTTGEDGFFDFGHDPIITSEYTVCASKCPSTDCNLTPHTSTDCLSAGCHAKPDLRIYVTSPNLGGTGGAPPSGTNCVSPTRGGPYVHSEPIYNPKSNQPCIACHELPYIGGYLYDGPTSAKTVAEATIEVIPESGSPLTAVSGPDGMFFFGTNAAVTVPQALTAPYTACVSKCPTAKVCSIPNGHTTTADCGSCHDGSTADKVYLQ